METLQEVRKTRGLTQTQLAEALGVTQMYIAHLERGRKRYSPELAVKAAQVLRIKKAQLHSLSRLANLHYTLDLLGGLDDVDLVRAGEEGRQYLVRLVKIIMEFVAAGEVDHLSVDLPGTIIQAANEIARQTENKEQTTSPVGRGVKG